ncbi:hypothetical protein J9317_13145 [Metabacillus sp. KIGAM252]|uniref:Nucleotidase n=1 Tax=Metabacillus flavus TaxID=2823519 RepID=A0ABS5LG85_9BACI|nr:hypothetical protein [Metabacillus flavus]MBS2969712.1 hypothetical protein [Metabacillus flavus]
MLRLGIDIDGTITPPETFVPYLNKSFNKQITLDDIKDYDLTKALEVSYEELNQWMAEFEPIIYGEAPVSKGAKEILGKWKKKHDLIFISARGHHLYDTTLNWFEKNQVSYHNIDLVGSHDKLEAVKKHGIDVFFEDKHDNACMIGETFNIPVILFNTPYNQDPVPEQVVRVNSWFEAEEWVDRRVLEQKENR